MILQVLNIMNLIKIDSAINGLSKKYHDIFILKPNIVKLPSFDFLL